MGIDLGMAMHWLKTCATGHYCDPILTRYIHLHQTFVLFLGIELVYAEMHLYCSHWDHFKNVLLSLFNKNVHF